MTIWSTVGIFERVAECDECIPETVANRFIIECDEGMPETVANNRFVAECDFGCDVDTCDECIPNCVTEYDDRSMLENVVNRVVVVNLISVKDDLVYSNNAKRNAKLVY